jgi:hypothetical protein
MNKYEKAQARYMYKLTFSRQTLLLGSGVILLLAAGGLVLVTRPHASVHRQTSKTKTVTTIASKTESITTSNSPLTSQTSVGNTAAADKQEAVAVKSQPVVQACKLLTLAIARQLLGDGAQTSTASTDSSVAVQTADTTVTTCAYTSGNDNVQLLVRAPTSSLGDSENDTMFGSGRPSDAVSVQGYGQAGYWDPSQYTFNVLGNNTWYIISRNTNTEGDTVAVAKLLASGF